MAQQLSAQAATSQGGSDQFAAELKEFEHQAAGGVAVGVIDSPLVLRHGLQVKNSLSSGSTTAALKRKLRVERNNHSQGGSENHYSTGLNRLSPLTPKNNREHIPMGYARVIFFEQSEGRASRCP